MLRKLAASNQDDVFADTVGPDLSELAFVSGSMEDATHSAPVARH